MKTKIKNLWKDESAQGATEYILLLVVVVALVIMFGPKLKGMLNDRMSGVGDQMGGLESQMNQ